MALNTLSISTNTSGTDISPQQHADAEDCKRFCRSAEAASQRFKRALRLSSSTGTAALLHVRESAACKLHACSSQSVKHRQRAKNKATEPLQQPGSAAGQGRRTTGNCEGSGFSKPTSSANNSVSAAARPKARPSASAGGCSAAVAATAASPRARASRSRAAAAPAHPPQVNPSDAQN
jgi:hypothetical protein